MPKSNRSPAPTEAQSVDASPEIQRAIAEAVELIETTQRALEPDERRVSEYGALGQAVAKPWAAHNQVELLPSGAIAPAGGEGLDELLHRMLDIVSHPHCADRVLFDLQNVPEALQPACIVLHRATQDRGRLRVDLDEWSSSQAGGGADERRGKVRRHRAEGRAARNAGRDGRAARDGGAHQAGTGSVPS
jgi:hypothetical protein